MRRHTFLKQLLNSAIISVLAPVAMASNLEDSETWKQFRGNNATAFASGQKVPVNLGKETLRWSVNLSGRGSSSPVIWGERLFVTSEDREAGQV
ncbi:MAG: hypothetical protein CBC31_010160, partial [Verrucomicrobia bacterium TMED71]